MPDLTMTREVMDNEVKRLEALLRVRRGKPGFTENVAEIEARLAAVKAERAALDAPTDE